MRKIFDFHGGIHPPENKFQSTQNAIASLPLAKQLVLSLNQHIGAAADPLVSLGEKVLKGQLIASAHGNVSANIHAPTSGTISAIEERVSNHPSGMSSLAVVIDTDGRDQWTVLQDCASPFELDALTIIEKVRAAGIAGMGGAGFPTAIKLGAQQVDTLILNAAECEPYISADDMLMREHSDEILCGALLIACTLPQLKSILIGIEDNKPEAITALNKAILEIEKSEYAIEVVVVPTKYPSGGEKQLIKLLTGKEVPTGKIPASIGIVMQNVGTCRAAWRAIRYGEPLISRVTTVVGKALSKQGNFELPIGTPIQHILEQLNYKTEDSQRIIIGGPMMGWAIDDTEAPVIKTTNCVLVPSHEEIAEPPPEQACIRCGMCAQACPAELLPQQLYWYARAEEAEKLKAYNLFDCIECGACSWVCPSNIPLVQYYRAAKGSIRHAEAEKQKSDLARLRFEARQERIAKAEAEKEAKRAERKKAAEEAKQVLAGKLTNKTDSDNSQIDMKAIKADLVKDALAAVTNAETDPDKENAKLARGLSSAESRLERAQESLLKHQQEGADSARLDALAARVKDAEQKVAEAQRKLEEFNS